MSKEILISVIVPIYMVEEYLERCLDSIINQTYKELEIILIDDGSPDNCGYICDQYAQHDNRIIVVHKANGGVSDARNYGLNICKGTYIAFVDPDDHLLLDYFEKLSSVAVKEKCDITIGHFVKGNERIYSILKEDDQYRIYDRDELLNLWHGDFTHIEAMVCGKLYHRDVFAFNTFNEIRFPVGRVFEDTIVAHQLVYNANYIVIINSASYIYNYNPNSTMNSYYTIKKLEDFNYAQEERLRFFENNGYWSSYNRLYIFVLKAWVLSCSKMRRQKMHNSNEFKRVRTKFIQCYNVELMRKTLLYEKVLFTLFRVSPFICAYCLLPLYERLGRRK